MRNVEFTKEVAFDLLNVIHGIQKMNGQYLYMQNEIISDDFIRLSNMSNLCQAGLQYAVEFFQVGKKEEINNENTLVDSLYKVICKHPKDSFYYLYCFYDYGMSGFIANGSEYLRGFSAFMCGKVPQGEPISQDEMVRLVHRK